MASCFFIGLQRKLAEISLFATKSADYGQNVSATNVDNGLSVEKLEAC
tara:strand:- start:428 stop:571 length:144 start_codon:yes stop_codon:yes gene_type:complete